MIENVSRREFFKQSGALVLAVFAPEVLSQGAAFQPNAFVKIGPDSAVTVIIPPVSAEARQLQRAARVAFNSGVAVARAGQSLREVGRAVESAAKREGAVVVRELTGT